MGPEFPMMCCMLSAMYRNGALSFTITALESETFLIMNLFNIGPWDLTHSEILHSIKHLIKFLCCHPFTTYACHCRLPYSISLLKGFFHQYMIFLISFSYFLNRNWLFIVVILNKHIRYNRRHASIKKKIIKFFFTSNLRHNSHSLSSLWSGLSIRLSK